MSRHDQIDYIDLDAVRNFYSRVFNWSVTDYGPAYTSFQDGRIAGGFARSPVSESPSPLPGPLVVIFVDDLHATHSLITQNGGAITKEIFSFPGGSRFHFTDPSGNELAAWHED